MILETATGLWGLLSHMPLAVAPSVPVFTPHRGCGCCAACIALFTLPEFM